MSAATPTPPLPYVGAVIRYGYLWRDQHRRDRDGGGRKDRPCLILAIVALETGEFRVYVVPLTTQAPSGSDEDSTIKLGGPTMRKLGLAKDRPSWIVCTEVNDFIWRGFDVVALDDGRDHYGALPDPVFEATRLSIRERLRAEPGVATVNRDSTPS